MKKIFFLIALTISINAFSQCAGSNSLSMEVRHWFWAAFKHGAGTDSTSIARVAALKTQMIAANPADSTTSVNITGVPNDIIIFIYDRYVNSLTFGEYMNMGSTDAQRRTIFTNIRAISTPCVVSAVANIDYEKAQSYFNNNKIGKAVIKNN